MTNQEKNAQLTYGTRIVPKGSTNPNGSLVVEAAAKWSGIGGTGCELPAPECPAMMANIQAGLREKLRIWIPGTAFGPVNGPPHNSPTSWVTRLPGTVCIYILPSLPTMPPLRNPTHPPH